MIRLAPILLLLFVATPTHLAGQSSSDFLVWSENAGLEWKDFRGPVDSGTPSYQGAASYLSIAIRMSCANGVPNLRVSAEFDRGRSWARTGMPASLLDHEQVHFDIAELYARRTRVEWREVEDPCGSAATVRAIAQGNSRLAEGLHDVYDAETRHGTEPDAQAEWSGRIRLLLDASIND